MKILLLNPPMQYGVYNQAGKPYLDKSYPPLGLGYIDALAKKEGFKTQLYDLIENTFEDAKKIIKKENPQIIAISCNLTDYRWGAFRIAQIAKKLNPKITVILGGSHATHLYQQILSNFPIDYIVLSEGEYTFLELINNIKNQTDTSKIKGIVYKSKEKIIKTQERSPIQNLDVLPFPTRFFHSNYIRYSSSNRFKEKKITKLKSSHIIASRGCPFNCYYCSITKYWKSYCRFRSPKNVVDEMEKLHKENGVNHFNFFDDTFTIDQNRTIKLCKEIINRNLDVCWECVTRVDCVSQETLIWMKKSGCLGISYGVESGSVSVLEAINKNQTKNQIIQAFQLTHKIGLLANVLLMVGNPKETRQSINETIELIKIIKPDKLRTTLTIIYPETNLYKKCKKSGLIQDQYWLTKKAAPIYTAENTVKQLKKWEKNILFSFYIQKKQLLTIYQTIIYQTIFVNLKEITQLIFPFTQNFLEKIDHILHKI